MNKICFLVAASCLSIAALHAQTFSDDFDDDVRDAANWEDPVVYDGTTGQLLEQTQRVEFSANPAADNFVSQQLKHYPSYSEPWQVQMVVSMDKTNVSSLGETAIMSVEVGAPGDKYVTLGYAVGVLPGETNRQALYAEGTDSANPDGISNLDVRTLPDAIGIRVTYDPNLHVIRTYYDLDADQTDGDWTLFQAYTIDASTVEEADTLDWGMATNDAFFIVIGGSSEGAGIASGSAWADDFEFNLGSTAQRQAGISFIDDFNDDSRDPDWSDPFVDNGTPTLIEGSHRLEFVSDSSVGEQEIGQSIDWGFLPQYDQAFDIKVEAHCLPAAMTIQDQVGGLDLVIGHDFGAGDLTLSVAALFDAGSRKQGLAADNSEVDPLIDWPESIQFGPLPEVVGLRMVWAPDTKILRCYFDTDGNRTVETWVLFADYTLDGSTNGTTHIADWQMSATNRFWISLNGYAENTIVDSGEAYFDNFSLVNTLPLIGYSLWASAIPDPGMRETTDDASGNGISNLLQYMYGLAPMATDTDVQLSIQLENGGPVLIHGLNASAPDYMFGYQFKAALSDAWEWASGSEPTLIETNSVGEKTFRETTLPLNLSDTFFRLGILPLP